MNRACKAGALTSARCPGVKSPMVAAFDEWARGRPVNRPMAIFLYNRGVKKPYTAKQGQYLAFIFYYTKIHGFAPAESDKENYFRMSPPSVHQMVLTLEVNGFLKRIPGKGRSICLLIPREELPELE